MLPPLLIRGVRRALIALLLLVIVLPVAPLWAQNDGQFCARAFEDRNANGVRDAGEPFLTRGVGATLQDARGVVVATAILDNSPTAGQGVICFQNLAYTQYTLTITSAEFTPTTADSLIVVLERGQTPPVLDYGGQRIVATTPATSTAGGDSPDQDALVERALVAAVGSGVAMSITALLGVFIWAIFLRPRRPAPAGMPAPDDARFRRPDDTR